MISLPILESLVPINANFNENRILITMNIQQGQYYLIVTTYKQLLFKLLNLA